MAARLSEDSAIVLVGFMGAGKSTAAKALAAATGRAAFDLDEVIAQRHGKAIEQIFEQEGEAAFRAAETEVALELLSSAELGVIALGGGTLGAGAVREALRAHVVLWLDVDPDTAWERCSGSERPLARDRHQFAELHAQREPLYEQVADVVVVGAGPVRWDALAHVLSQRPLGAKLLWATSASGDHPAFIGPGLTSSGFWPPGIPGRRFLITDGTVARHYAERLEPLRGRVSIMPGEQSKTIAHAEIVWTELVRAGMTRADVVVALGGGVVGDLAGFCAATYQRGVRYLQVPTTLLAMVDSAYGGKTGVDLPEAKNYVGAYHLPCAVIADTDTLATLPAAELSAGYAEVLKTALLAGGELWQRMLESPDPADPGLIAACALTKLRVVARDERDSGHRQILNLGHTVAHAIEQSTGYARYRHGEAVGLGLLAALRLSGQEQLRVQVAELLASRQLPITLEGADPDAVVMATARDKKRLGEGPVPFVLLDSPGAPRVGCQVPARDLIRAVRELAS